MKTVVKIAEIPFEADTLFDASVQAFAAYQTDEAPLFTIKTEAKDIEKERRHAILSASHEKKTCPHFSREQLESTALCRKIAEQLPRYDAFLFHGAAVAVGENAFLFTAPSGTGKTTHARLWCKNIDGAFMVNGDKPIVRLIEGKPFVCGTPWQGKENLGCAKIFPLCAIAFLHRSDENRVEKAKNTDAALRLLRQTFRPTNGEAIRKTMDLLQKTEKTVPLYELFCNCDDDAATVAFNEMGGQKP